jgi:hypothetical protein
MLSQDDIFARYKRYREVGLSINNALVKSLAKGAMKKGGKELGILKKGTLIFDSDDEISILMDYCIHTNRTEHKTTIDRYLEKSPPDPVSDEMLILKALQDSYFSVFVVDRTEDGYLCRVRDIIYQKNLTIIDSGLGKTAVDKMLLATRIMPIPVSDMFMTTGTAIPFTKTESYSKFEHIITKFSYAIDTGTFSKSQEASLSKQVIRLLLKTKSLEQMRYGNVTDPSL